MNSEILFVDDEPNILSSYQRQLRGKYGTAVAQGGQQGLAAIAENGPFAVVVSDLRMPGLSGIEFLARVKETTPDSVRILLTGQGSLDAAVAAVNQGHIFRFLSKPCAREILVEALDAALEQHRLITAEKVLLEQTLKGSIKVLMEILTIVNPVAFSRAWRLKHYVKQIAEILELPNRWRFEVAAMLSQIGCVTLAPETLQKVAAGQALDEAEQQAVSEAPQVARRLLAEIPRLDDVCGMLTGFSGEGAGDERFEGASDEVRLGGQMIQLASRFDALIHGGLAPPVALEQLKKEVGPEYGRLLSALEQVKVPSAGRLARAVGVKELTAGMILDQDLHASNGLLLVTRNQEITLPLIERLKRFATGVGVEEPFRVLVERTD